ncbi:MAG: exosortase/archaeosortase family protein [Chthonomonas sp.]|nr:exosortase/archaeosortase family protein [Chthonomonas sp.]
MSTANPETLDGQPGLLGIDWIKVRNSPAFVPGLIVLASIIFGFFALLQKLPDMWFDDEGYYSHGVLVPFIAGYIVYKWWPKLSTIPVRPFYPAIAIVLGALFVYQRAYVAGIDQFMSAAFVLALLGGAWFTLGFKWTLYLAVPILYLAFMLPVWTGAIDSYTNPLQLLSTKIAYGMLDIGGFRPFQDSPTIIYLNRFTLDVGVPCSGFKLVLAVSCFMIFFVCIARLNIWANMIMFVSVLPLCLFINGLRIALIGVVGDEFGQDAGHKFHDYSGYLTLLICFFVLFKLARILGWKD